MPNQLKLHYSNEMTFMDDKNLVSFGHVPVVVNASIKGRNGTSLIFRAVLEVNCPILTKESLHINNIGLN